MSFVSTILSGPGGVALGLAFIFSSMAAITFCLLAINFYIEFGTWRFWE